MDMTSIEVPAELLAAAKMSAEDVKTLLAKELYKRNRLTSAQAIQLGGQSASLEEIFIRQDAPARIDMDQFISWAAHDFKSPLNAIIGFTKVVLKGIDGPVNEMQITDLTSAHVNGQRMLNLANNLIDMARLNNGDIRIEIGEGDLALTISEACNRWKTQNPAKELQTSVDLGQAAFSFDGARIRQVVGGLLTYAGNHVAEGGRISLSAALNAQTATVEITSHGNPARDKYDMDLAMISFIARGLISLHGGSLTIGPDTGQGIGVRFSLPKA